MKLIYNVYDSFLDKVLIVTHNNKLCQVAIGATESGLIDHYLLNKHQDQIEYILDDIDPDLVKKVINVINTGATENIDYDAMGTSFQRRVWAEISKVPAGQTITYKELANRVGSPRAVRAVGSACKSNPIAVIIPCHRVILSNGCGGRYAWGIDRKIRLLERENVKYKFPKDKYAGLSLQTRVIREIQDIEDKRCLSLMRKSIKNLSQSVNGIVKELETKSTNKI
jgi:AraC family transcriptional regulator of adaptative response/methylated-DNA-[protein]-cysteine methyltransferase